MLTRHVIATLGRRKIIAKNVGLGNRTSQKREGGEEGRRKGLERAVEQQRGSSRPPPFELHRTFWAAAHKRLERLQPSPTSGWPALPTPFWERWTSHWPDRQPLIGAVGLTDARSKPDETPARPVGGTEGASQLERCCKIDRCRG